jgi:DNA-directed RNA polymerase sigma subunit (sigma70/sigma32)
MTAHSNLDEEYLIQLRGGAEAGYEEACQEVNESVSLDKYMGLLTDTEAKVVQLRNGLGEKSPTNRNIWTLKEISDIVNLSKERVRQIQCKAYKKIREGVTPEKAERSKRSSNKHQKMGTWQKLITM